MPIALHDVQEIQLTGTGDDRHAAANASGSARWKLRGQWAELVLVLWSTRYMPEHPQIVGRTWLPGDWFMHAAAHGYDRRYLRLAALHPARPGLRAASRAGLIDGSVPVRCRFGARSC